jgi:hypothetical protein
MEVGDKYTKGRKECTIVRINETPVATYIMLQTEDGRTFTVGEKTLKNEYTKENK